MAMDVRAQHLLQQARKLEQAGRGGQAATAYQDLLQQYPELPDVWYALGYLLRQLGRFDDALTAYAQALERGVRDPHEVHLNRAVIFTDYLHDHDAAERELLAALRLDPNYVPARLNLGNLCEDLGQREQAIAHYEQILIQPERGGGVPALRVDAIARLLSLRVPESIDDPWLQRAADCARSSDPIDDSNRANLLFALGRTYDALRSYDLAFAAFADANHHAGRNGPPYRPQAMKLHVDALIAATPRSFAASPPNDHGDRLEPVFICGMFRSGSTLIEQVLNAHPLITAGGELDFFPRLVAGPLAPFPASMSGLDNDACATLAMQYREHLQRIVSHQGSGARYVTDKRPDNFLLLGLIKRLFPRARIIHTTRDPLDNGLSVFTQHLHQAAAPYSSDLSAIGHYYGQYRRLLAHFDTCFAEDILRFDYDQFVRDPEPCLRRLLEFLQLPWDARCLDFHAQRSTVKTASLWQVRRPLYRESSGRWRNYTCQLQPLRDALLQAGIATPPAAV